MNILWAIIIKIWQLVHSNQVKIQVIAIIEQSFKTPSSDEFTAWSFKNNVHISKYFLDGNFTFHAGFSLVFVVREILTAKF